jgi:hypothetical protein
MTLDQTLAMSWSPDGEIYLSRYEGGVQKVPGARLGKQCPMKKTIAKLSLRL